jgi:hypothetical protein
VASTSGVQRHRLDTFALTTGLLAVALAALALAARGGADVDGLVALATVWVVLGAVGLTRVLHHLLAREGRDVPHPEDGNGA